MALSLLSMPTLSYSGITFSSDWTAFKTRFAKEYSSITEETRRFEIFIENMKQAATANAEAEHAIHQTQGVTKFMDMTKEEFNSIYRARKSSNSTKHLAKYNGECTACTRFPQNAELLNNLPTDFDWTTQGAVTGIKDQGSCGSCWAFGTVVDVEGTMFLAGNPLTSLSEQELVSCDKQDAGCNGGLQETAFEYVISTGLATEKAYPYTSGRGRTGSCVSQSSHVAKISSWVQVSSSASEEAAIKTALVASGPVTIGVNADTMQRYTGGIDNPRVCLSGYSMLDHGVTIVGYGEEAGKPYWKVKNSWGTDWGEDGYWRVAYGGNKCGVATDAVHSVY